MKRTVFLIAAVSLMAVALLGCSPQPAPQPVPVVDATTGAVTAALPTITVSGTGELTLSPDMATIQFGVEANKHPSAQAAMDAASLAIEQVSAKLQELGVAKEDLQTTNFYMYQGYDYDDKGNIKGEPWYNVSNTLSATIYDVDNVGKYVDTAIAAGATNVNGVTFSIKDPLARENEALALALENAQSRASALAAASGKQLGEVLLLNDGTQIMEQVYEEALPQAAPEAMRADASAGYGGSASGGFMPGSYTLKATVSARFILADA